MRQLGNRINYDTITLACDVGGTNTSIAAVGRIGNGFEIIDQRRYASPKLPDLFSAIQECLKTLIPDGTQPETICISGAGPVHEGFCRLSNVAWDIDGTEIERKSNIRTLVVNDFTAISYGIPLLDVNDPEQITVLPHPDGTVPVQNGPVRAVVGAGTGLGVGFLIENAGKFIAFPSEGGHSDFAPADETGRALREYIREKTGHNPGTELFVSGRGIANTLAFFQSTGRLAGSAAFMALQPDEPDTPQRVSDLAATGDGAAKEVMATFVRHYARFASNAALHFYPGSGLFLAGGIVTKNLRWFTDDHWFMRNFLENYRENIRSALANFPVYVVRDYAISLYGAAHAAYSLSAGEKT